MAYKLLEAESMCLFKVLHVLNQTLELSVYEISMLLIDLVIYCFSLRKLDLALFNFCKESVAGSS